jgi:tetratricopeptide (TPR) repeat protein
MAVPRKDRVPAETLMAAWQRLDGAPASVACEAEALLRAAPGDAEARLLLAAARRRQGDIAGARGLLGPCISATTASPIAWFEWGQILGEAGDDVDALAALRRAVALAPEFAGAWRALGDLLIALGSGVEAGQAYAQAARAATADPELAPAARALCDGRAGEAERLLKAHLRRSPDDGRAMRLLGEAAMRVGRAVEAEAVLTHCLDLSPGFAEARHSLAILLYVRGKFGAAVPHLRRLLEVLPHQPSLRLLLTVSLVETGDFAAAVPLYEAMLARFPDRTKIWLSYGHALKTLGRVEEAARAYRRCLDLAPVWSAGVYLSLADLKTEAFTPGEIAAMQRRLAAAAEPAFDRAQLHYALAHALEQQRDYAAAFDHYTQGAAARRGAITYDPDRTSAYVAAAKATFTTDFCRARAGGGDPSDAPIFIVGLPRSGSTLVEQILASHSWVDGTSELKQIGQIAADVRGGGEMTALPGLVAGLDAADRARLGRRYLEETRQYRRLGRARFTDKMPDNFLHGALIHLILPNARIIDVRRGAMASGVAAFKQFFQVQQSGQDYTYDLAEIGRYYRDYAALMAHFDLVLPGRILRVCYEDLVADTEGQVRRLLDYCGLAFEPACLRFWETPRSVQTPSAQQVRGPIFRSGIDLWRNYAPWLGPLREALGPFAEACRVGDGA